MNIRDIYALFFSVLNILNIDISNLSVFFISRYRTQGYSYKNIFNLTVNENSHYLNKLVLNKSHESWNMCVWFLQYGNGNSYVGYHMFFTIPYFEIYLYSLYKRLYRNIYLLLLYMWFSFECSAPIIQECYWNTFYKKI